jgi:hypothetical protein
MSYRSLFSLSVAKQIKMMTQQDENVPPTVRNLPIFFGCPIFF